ncbi:carboxymuconolactone decarboxylase family protein [Bradyrhizobium sp. 31Argb]|uniref:carboxymuconolactone decarboxylase family protein n=1 Tax=unclassified Bradyrhizobium TaxID=2631580 RepID=UPI00102E5589|nr:carboxymuconolactone decarboxylase family protein [Bradyrhizobium sp. Leo170]TAI61766.1 carboxymuconolactone decarboxylase [Bradyrhizobium sp. Leo170]
MPRVHPLSSDALPAPVAEVYERFVKFGPFQDQAAILAHVPPALDHLYRMLMELKVRGGVPWRYVELAIVVTSKLNACAFCVASHSPVLRIEGISDAAIATLPAGDHPDFDDTDRLVIEYATLITQKAGQIRDGVFERLRACFSDSQIVELTLRVALAGFFNRFNDALQIDDGRALAVFERQESESQTQELE